MYVHFVCTMKITIAITKETFKRGSKIVSNVLPEKNERKREIVIHKSQYGRETQTSKQFPHPTHSNSLNFHSQFILYTQNIMDKCVFECILYYHSENFAMCMWSWERERKICRNIKMGCIFKKSSVYLCVCISILVEDVFHDSSDNNKSDLASA